LLACAQFAAPACHTQQQPKLSGNARAQVSNILRDAHDEVKKHYYDPKFHGLDWDARYREYSAQLASIQTVGDGFRIVAAFLEGLKDSHTFFEPPERVSRTDYGYRLAMVGNSCFVTQVRPNSDAESKLHIGDQLVGLNGYRVDREDFHDISYFLNILAPQVSVRLDLLSPAGELRQVVVNASVGAPRRMLDLSESNDYWDFMRRLEGEDHATRSKIVETGDAAIWNIQQFNLSIDSVEKGIAIARKHKVLILDLRSNPGGSVDMLEHLVGMLFDHEIKISDRVGRKDQKPALSMPGGKPFDGKLIVLVDARSASASELLARVVQLEHRGTVIGDRSAGSVMEATPIIESPGTETRIFYAFSVTDANLIMRDGKSLEKTGVTPDELLLPTGADLAAGRDPVLSHAAELAGVKLDPVEAGKLFPYVWLPI
jgi:C-terminal processing protease CtpA/Prc